MDENYAGGLVDNVINGMSDQEYKKRRKRLPRNRMMEIPNF